MSSSPLPRGALVLGSKRRCRRKLRWLPKLQQLNRRCSLRSLLSQLKLWLPLVQRQRRSGVADSARRTTTGGEISISIMLLLLCLAGRVEGMTSSPGITAAIAGAVWSMPELLAALTALAPQRCG